LGGPTEPAVSVGASSMVGSTTVENNGATGILVANACQVTGCTIISSGHEGILSFAGSAEAGGLIVSDCSLRGNGVKGGAAPTYDGIRATDANISSCSIALSNRDGISLTDGGTVTNCTVTRSGRHGILAGPFEDPKGPQMPSEGSIIAECTVWFNEMWGIAGAWGIDVTDCSVRHNGKEDTPQTDVYVGGGIWLGWNGLVSDCAVSQNHGPGVLIKRSCAVRGNTITRNWGHGVWVLNAYNTVAENDIHENGWDDFGSFAVDNLGYGIMLGGRSTEPGNAGYNYDTEGNEVRVDRNHIWNL